MDEKQETVKALIDERAIFCGHCGHKLGTTEGFQTGKGNGKLFLICKHKDGGQRCKALNEIDL